MKEFLYRKLSIPLWVFLSGISIQAFAPEKAVHYGSYLIAIYLIDNLLMPEQIPLFQRKLGFFLSLGLKGFWIYGFVWNVLMH
jgi:hypothetical protein